MSSTIDLISKFGINISEFKIWFVTGDELYLISQVSIASLKPGVIRGNHYHLNKKEWFMVIGGKAKFCLADPETNEKTCFKLSDKKPKVITVFPKIVHAVKNIDKKIIYFIEADSVVYNHKKPDAISYLICK